MESTIKKLCRDCKHLGSSVHDGHCLECFYRKGRPKYEPKEDTMNDIVNHPKHYEGSTSFECIELMEIIFGEDAAHKFCELNAFKYAWRWKNKNGTEDLDKAMWYLDRAEQYQGGSTSYTERLRKYIEHCFDERKQTAEDILNQASKIS